MVEEMCIDVGRQGARPERGWSRPVGWNTRRLDCRRLKTRREYSVCGAAGFSAARSQLLKRGGNP